MKKFYAILVVLALVIISSVAMAEVTVSGSVDIRSLSLNNPDTTADNGDRNRTTQDRYRINIDAKHENVKARVTFENDWEIWGSQQNNTNGNILNPLPAPSTVNTGIEARPGQSSATNKFGIREGWIDFTLPGLAPAHVKVGHQFLQLGNGWFFRSMKYGSDAWVVGLPGRNTIAFVDVKAAEGTNGGSDDTDAYVLLDTFKLTDTQTIGAYFVRVNDPRARFFVGTTAPSGSEANLDNIGLWFNGKLGPMNLQAEIDLQMGSVEQPGLPDSKFKGNQVVLQANLPIDPLSINATIARGTGDDAASTSADTKSYIPVLDADPHYTIVYEYFSKTACGLKNTGFCNTMAFNLGAGMNVAKKLSINLDLWMLQAVEKVALNGFVDPSDDLGIEVDLVLNWKLYDQLTWKWQLARMMPGDAYKNAAGKTEDIDAVQGVLSYKF